MKAFIKVMKALSDPNRVKIVKMLQHKLMCVCEMREALQLSQPSVSKHLKILEDAGLVDFKKDGLWVNYNLTDGSKYSIYWNHSHGQIIARLGDPVTHAYFYIKLHIETGFR